MKGQVQGQERPRTRRQRGKLKLNGQEDSRTDRIKERGLVRMKTRVPRQALADNTVAILISLHEDGFRRSDYIRRNLVAIRNFLPKQVRLDNELTLPKDGDLDK